MCLCGYCKQTSMDIKLILLVIFLPPLLGWVTYTLIHRFFEDILWHIKESEMKGFAGYINLLVGYLIMSLTILFAISLIFRFNFEIYEPLSAIVTIFVLALIFMVRIQIVTKGPQYFDIFSLFIGASFLIIFTNLLFHPDYLTSLDAYFVLIENFLIFIGEAFLYAFFGSLGLTFLAEPLIQSFLKKANI